MLFAVLGRYVACSELLHPALLPRHPGHLFDYCGHGLFIYRMSSYDGLQPAKSNEMSATIFATIATLF